jgi:diacylglycerol kinase (ATP)
MNFTEKEFVFFVNPKSAFGKNYKLSKKIKEILENFGYSIFFIETNNPDELRKSVKEYYLNGKRNFFIAGGDGSLFQVINAIMSVYKEGDVPKIGILPLGTGNALYSSIFRYVKNKHTRIVESIIHILESNLKSIDVFKLECVDGKSYYFVNMFLSGFFAEIINVRQKYFSKIGSLGYNLSILYQFYHFRKEKNILKYKIDGEELSFPNVSISYILNSKYIGNKINVSPFSFVSDGLGEFIICKDVDKFSLLELILRNISGDFKPIFSDKVKYFQFKELEFLSDKGEENIILDGELISVIPKKISIISNAIKVFS